VRPVLAITGLLLMLLAFSSFGNAYHIQPNVGINGGSSPETWTGPVGAILNCEHNDISDRSPPGGLGLTGVSEGGQGGLCFMSVGSDSGFGTCTTPTVGNEGRSTGWAPHYNGAGQCPNIAVSPGLPPINAPSPAYYKIQMFAYLACCPFPTHAGPPVPFQAEIGNLCSATGLTAFIYDDQMAYTMTNGHVAGFPSLAPATGSAGTYTVTADPGPATPLSAPLAPPCPTLPPR
jgi:hypothetical protein